MSRSLKNSVGIWAFGPNVTRFMPGGYHPEAVQEDMVERTSRAVAGLKDLVDDYEYHYPGELNEENCGAIKRALGEHDVYAVALGLFSNPRYKHGSFINPDRQIREETIRITKAGLDLAAQLGARFIIWPGGEGYNYLFQVSYADMWRWMAEGIAEVADYAREKGVLLLLEHKNSEPAMNIIMRNVGMTMYLIHKIREMGIPTDQLKINLDWQHLIMNGENLGEYVELLLEEGLLGHLHANSGWGTFDDDNMVGTSYFMQTLEVATILQDYGYGKNGERIGFDLFPYTEDQVQAIERSVLQWEFIWQLASKIDRDKLRAARVQRDAVKGYEAVYEALGLDKDFVRGLKG